MRRFPRTVLGINTKTKTSNMSDYDKTHILHPNNKEAMLHDFSEMLDEHGETINKAVERSSKNKRTLRVSIEIDKSNGRPVFGTVFSMVTVDPLKDRRQTQADDLDQPPLIEVPKSKKKANK